MATSATTHERLPTVLYRTPHSSVALNGTPGSTTSHHTYTPLHHSVGTATARQQQWHHHQGYSSPASPLLSPLTNSNRGTPIQTNSLSATTTPYIEDSDVYNKQVGASASRQLYGSGNAPPPPIMSLREGARPTKSDSRSHAYSKGMDGSGGPNPLLAHEYAFGSSTSGSSGANTSSASERESNHFRSLWVTVYGFQQQGDKDLILRELQECGNIVCSKNGGGNERANFMHIQFQTKIQAEKALRLNGKQLSKNLMIGITPIAQQHCSLVQGSSSSSGGGSSSKLGGIGMVSSSYSAKQQALMGNMPESMPQPVNTFWSKVNEYIFGL